MNHKFKWLTYNLRVDRGSERSTTQCARRQARLYGC